MYPDSASVSFDSASVPLVLFIIRPLACGWKPLDSQHERDARAMKKPDNRKHERDARAFYL